jgi:hypothetical protein
MEKKPFVSFKSMLNLYFAFVIIFGIKYNYQHVHRHGWVSWFIFGELIESSKAVFWPAVEIYNGIYPYQPKLNESKIHLENALTLYMSGQKIMKENSKGDGAMRKLDSLNSEKMIQLQREAYKEAVIVKPEEIRDENLRLHFTEEFRKGLEIYLSGIDNNDDTKLVEGSVLLMKFSSWFGNYKF